MQNNKIKKLKHRIFQNKRNQKISENRQIFRNKVKNGEAKDLSRLTFNMVDYHRRFDNVYLNKARQFNIKKLFNSKISNLHNSRIILSELNNQIVHITGMVSDVQLSKKGSPMILIEKPTLVNQGPIMDSFDKHMWLFMDQCYGTIFSASPVKYIAIGDYIVIHGLVTSYKNKYKNGQHYTYHYGISNFIISSCGQCYLNTKMEYKNRNKKKNRPGKYFSFISNYDRLGDWIIKFKNVKHFDLTEITLQDLKGKPQVDYEFKPSRYHSFFERMKEDKKD